MSIKPHLVHLKSIPLHHRGDCELLGVTPDYTLYVEEIYDDDDWIAQHILTLDGTFQGTMDEKAGKNRQFRPIKLPENAKKNKNSQATAMLNYRGARHRGLAAAERIQETTRPLSISTKMALVKQLGLNIMPPMVLGVAESYVLSETVIKPPDLYLVCRRIRIAYALPALKVDPGNMAYDYDTLAMYIVHFYEAKTYDYEVAIDEALAGLPDVELRRPMSCMCVDKYLFIAEGGTETTYSTVHIWEITRE